MFESQFGRLEGVGKAVASLPLLSHPCFMRFACQGTLPVPFFTCGCVQLQVTCQHEDTTILTVVIVPANHNTWALAKLKPIKQDMDHWPLANGCVARGARPASRTAADSVRVTRWWPALPNPFGHCGPRAGSCHFPARPTPFPCATGLWATAPIKQA